MLISSRGGSGVVFFSISFSLGAVVDGDWGGVGQKVAQTLVLRASVADLTYGTLMGAIRDAGMIAWDFDADATAVVDDSQRFWSGTFPLVTAFFCSHGYKVVRNGKDYFKILPCIPFLDSRGEFREAKAAVARDNIAAPLPRGALARAASARRAAGDFTATGVTALDVHVAVPSSSGGVFEWKKTFAHGDIFPVSWRTFGPLSLPVPARASHLLTTWYGENWRTKRVYKDAITGQLSSVPRGSRRTATPTRPLLRLHDAVV